MSQPQTKKSINGGLNKNQRDSTGDASNNQFITDNTPVNFYEMP